MTQKLLTTTISTLYDSTVDNATETASISLESTTTFPYSVPFTDVDVAVTAVLLSIFLLFGVAANTLTITVILHATNLKSIFNQFILSLCFSDLISALISWINLYRRTWGFNYFALPNAFCRIYWSMDIWTSYVTAAHILSFAVLRCVSVLAPSAIKRITRLHGKIWVCTIWFIALAAGAIPMGLFSGAPAEKPPGDSVISKWPHCSQLQQWLEQYKNYTYYAYSIFFYLPIIATIAVSIIIAVLMSRSSKRLAKQVSNRALASRKRREKQAILQLALIVGSFLIGYLPFTAFEFLTINSSAASTYADWVFDWRFGTAQYICLRFSECLNPIFYNLGSSKMRRETILFCNRFFGCSTRSLPDAPTESSHSPTVYVNAVTK